MVRVAVIALAAIGAAGVVLACSRDQPVGVRCGDITVPGTVVMPVGIQVTLRTAQGQAAAIGASVTVTNSSVSPASGFVSDSLTQSVYVPAGTYRVEIAKPAYRDTTIPNVVVLPSACNTVQTTKLSVVLQPLSGAPSVRSVGVAGAEFLATPGSQTKLVALVDADAAVSHAVVWRLSDTTMATVDKSGRVTAKCSVHGGTERATATSVANGAVSGSVVFGIGASGSC